MLAESLFADSVNYRSESLDPDRHDLHAFACGEPELDRWLRDHAVGAESRRVARTFGWVDAAGRSETVVGYYSLTGHVLVRDELLTSIGRGSPSQIPAVLLARLALDQRCHGVGDGAALLSDALSRVVEATATVAARFVVVDALHESAATFYEHCGFRRIPGTRRLIQKVSSIARSLGSAAVLG